MRFVKTSLMIREVWKKSDVKKLKEKSRLLSILCISMLCWFLLLIQYIWQTNIVLFKSLVCLHPFFNFLQFKKIQIIGKEKRMNEYHCSHSHRVKSKLAKSRVMSSIFICGGPLLVKWWLGPSIHHFDSAMLMSKPNYVPFLLITRASSDRSGLSGGKGL